MIAFPATAALIAVLCAVFVGWDALRRPRPERTTWAVAFVVFAIAAASEVIGSAVGWTPTLARVYYLSGAVLVVGILALGELYLLFPRRMPTFAPGLSLLIVAVATTAVWSAPIDPSRLQTDGWRALERGPFLVALAATINAGGTLVLVGGALYSTWKLRGAGNTGQRAAGCLLIAIGTIVVALGGTLTRIGRPEYLYLAMSAGIAIIFGGVLLTRPSQASRVPSSLAPHSETGEFASHRPRLISLPSRPQLDQSFTRDEGVQFMVKSILPLDDVEIAEACRRWSATPMAESALTRGQARQVWALRLGLPEISRTRFDTLPIGVQAQLAELRAEVWSATASESRGERGA